MAGMDIFNASAFSMTSLTGALEKTDFKPQMLGDMGIFEKMPVNTRNIFVDRRDGKMTLIPTSPAGDPPRELKGDDRDAVPLKTARIAEGFTLYAHELEGIRASGTTSELMSVQAEYLRRATRVRNNMDLTHEHHRLGAVQGKVLDADGTTVIYDYFTEFNEAEASAVSFELDVATTDVWSICNAITRSMARSSRGAFTSSTTVHALVGDAFFDALVTHPKVEKFYLNWNAAQSLKDTTAFSDFNFGKIVWHNYRGTDDNSTVAIDPDEAKFFPVGATDIFKQAMAPHESIETVNTMGRDTYMINVVDKDRNMWTKGELYSYSLYICEQPRVLRKATRT